MRVLPTSDGSRRDDAGFSLAESIVAIGIAMVVFLALAGALASTAKASLHARQNQNAVNLLNEQVERYRGVDVNGVAMQAADLTSADPRLAPSGTTWTFDPDGTGPLAAEQVVTAPGGSVNPHRLPTRILNKSSYSTSVYVTRPPADTAVAGAEYRRLTIVVTWTRGSLVRERRTSTFLTATRRGLPLPAFQWGTELTKSVAPGGNVAIPATLINRGAKDSWEIGAAFNPGVTWTKTWYVDTNADGDRDTGEPVMPDVDLDGKPETSLIQTDRAQAFLLVLSVPSSQALVNVTLTLSATSIAQPTHPNATQAFDDVVQVTTTPGAACTGCTFKEHFLHNRSSTPSDDTNRQGSMPMNQTAPTVGFLYDYDKPEGEPGRVLSTGGTGAGDDTASRSMTWTYSASTDVEFGGSVPVLKLWVKRAGATTAPVTMRAYLRYQTSGSSFADVTSGATPTGLTSGAFEEVQIQLPLVSDLLLPRMKELMLRVQVDGAPVHVAYDTAANSSVIALPVRTS